VLCGARKSAKKIYEKNRHPRVIVTIELWARAWCVGRYIYFFLHKTRDKRTETRERRKNASVDDTAAPPPRPPTPAYEYYNIIVHYTVACARVPTLHNIILWFSPSVKNRFSGSQGRLLYYVTRSEKRCNTRRQQQQQHQQLVYNT